MVKNVKYPGILLNPGLETVILDNFSPALTKLQLLVKGWDKNISLQATKLVVAPKLNYLLNNSGGEMKRRTPGSISRADNSQALKEKEQTSIMFHLKQQTSANTASKQPVTQETSGPICRRTKGSMWKNSFKKR